MRHRLQGRVTARNSRLNSRGTSHKGLSSAVDVPIGGVFLSQRYAYNPLICNLIDPFDAGQTHPWMSFVKLQALTL